MKKLLLFFAVFFVSFAFSQQETSTPSTSAITLTGNRIIKDGQSYKFSQYREVFKNQEAQNYFAKARANNTAGQIFAYAGGSLIGFGLVPALKSKTFTENGVTYVRDKSAAWTVVGIGAGLVGIAIPFASGAKKNAEKAITLENGGSTAFQPYFKLESAGTGLALSYNF